MFVIRALQNNRICNKSDVSQKKMYTCMQVAPLIGDSVEYLNQAWESGKRILVEGANATMLDLDFGTYPFVTSSNPSIGGVASGLGLAPTKFEAIIGVVHIWLSRSLQALSGAASSLSFLNKSTYTSLKVLCLADLDCHSLLTHA